MGPRGRFQPGFLYRQFSASSAPSGFRCCAAASVSAGHSGAIARSPRCGSPRARHRGARNRLSGSGTPSAALARATLLSHERHIHHHPQRAGSVARDLGEQRGARLHRRRLHRAGGEWPTELVRADLGRLRRRPTLRGAPDTQEASMSWDQLWVWVIWPVIVALILGLGGLWSARRIP